MNRIQIFGPIETETVSQVAEELDNCNGPLVAEICSDGGVVTGGIAIASMLRKYPGEVTTRAIGGVHSIASLIFLSGDKRQIEDDAMLHYHGPHIGGGGNREELEDSLADVVRAEKIMLKRYSEVTNLSEAELASRFNRENFLDAEEAVAQGFATEVVQSSGVMASSGRGGALATVRLMAKAEMEKNPRLQPHDAKRQVLKANAGLRDRLNAEANHEAPTRTKRRRGKSAAARLKRAVAAKLEANPRLRPYEAKRSVFKDDPQLRAGYVAETNEADEPFEDSPVPLDDPIAKLKALADEAAANGQTFEEMFAELRESDPELADACLATIR